MQEPPYRLGGSLSERGSLRGIALGCREAGAGKARNRRGPGVVSWPWWLLG